MNPIIMPCYNNLHLTRAAAITALAQDIGKVELWAINNGSSDGTAAWLNAFADKLTATHAYPPYPSLAALWNFALSSVFKLGAEYALIINNDVELRPDTYRLLCSDGGGFVTAVGVSPVDWAEARAATPAMKRSPHPDFSCYLIRRGVWERVGALDENFTIAFCEDLDYHCRLHQAGIDAYSLDVPYLHHASMTVKTAPRIEGQLISEQAEANREYFHRKWGFQAGTPEYEAFFSKGH